MKYKSLQFLAVTIALIGTLLIALPGCATLGPASRLVLEGGLEAAEIAWHKERGLLLVECEGNHGLGSAAAEACATAINVLDAQVDLAASKIDSALRAYWQSRSNGEEPDWRETALKLDEILATLPPEVRRYFELVRGLR